MTYELKCNLVGTCEALSIEDFTNWSFVPTVKENLDDVVSYLYEKQFNVPYKENEWWLEKGAKEFVVNLEEQYSSNKLNLWDFYHNEDFLEALSTKYSALYINEALDDLRSLIKLEVNAMDNDELDELWKETSGAVAFSVVSAKDPNIKGYSAYVLPEPEDD